MVLYFTCPFSFANKFDQINFNYILASGKLIKAFTTFGIRNLIKRLRRTSQNK